MARYIITEKDRIIRTDTYIVKVECENGTVFEALEPRRLFPLSDLNHYITLLNDKEKEVAMIKDLDAISPDSKEAIEGCFSDYYMIPTITEILQVEDKFGVLKWKVLTDRGEILFTIRNRHSDIKCYDGEHMLVRDSNDNRYLTTISKLDKKSLRRIYSYL